MSAPPNTQVFQARTQLDATATKVYEWHTRPGAFQRLQPPWEDVRLLDPGEGLAQGSRTVLDVPMGPFRKKWVAEHGEIRPGESFQDTQVQGPFAAWIHEHRMKPGPDDTCWLEDEIHYRLPLGALGRVLGGAHVRQTLERVFTYRHEVTRNDIKYCKTRSQTSTPTSTMRILVSGSNGLVGSSLIPLLTTNGHEVVTLTRPHSKSNSATIAWDPSFGSIDTEKLEGFDAVVHLAGENIAGGRWTASRKQKILESRTRGTRLLCDALAACKNPPRVLLSASAIGFYGDRGNETLNESSSRGQGFLSDVCEAWENQSRTASEAGIRVVNMRIGVVLSPAGGALKKMLPPFRMGAGGRLGNGRQMMSWIAIDDLIYAMLHALENESISGPVNAVSPGAVNNAEFTHELGTVLRRPTLFPMPATAARLAFGELADALLLSSQHVVPTRLLESGFEFRYPHLEDALRHVLGQKKAAS